MANLAVIGYDGSEDAQYAVDVAATRLRPRAAVVVHLWYEPLTSADATLPLGAPLAGEPDRAALELAAQRVADEGAERARAAGLAADAEFVRVATERSVADTLMERAEQLDADLVVVGRRGMGRVKSALLGSISDAVIRDGRRPVLVVPSPAA